LNVDTQGAKKIFQTNGTSAPAAVTTAALLANTTYQFTYASALDGGAGVWLVDPGGSGSTYTGGSGIDITGTVVSTTTALSTGRGYLPPFGVSYGNAFTTLSGTANDVWSFEFVAPYNAAITKLQGFQVTDNAGKHFAFAICDANCTTILATSSTITSATNTAFTPSLSVTLVANTTYNLLVTSDQSTATINMLSIDGSQGTYSVMNADASNPRWFSCANSSTGTTTLVFPATCGARTALSSKDPPFVILVK
jgi:hypothetical protein